MLKFLRGKAVDLFSLSRHAAEMEINQMQGCPIWTRGLDYIGDEAKKTRALRALLTGLPSRHRFIHRWEFLLSIIMRLLRF